MSGTEYLLAAMVILVPLGIAVMVTLWTLEQARLRNRKNRPRATPQQEELLRSVRNSDDESTGRG